ncbi:MAG: hypothetical protein KGH94_00120 [Candidatus Micrarchaeota archaeon]|nr:hypothetical protein [Candidatus Micrarchaeota archaeon]
MFNLFGGKRKTTITGINIRLQGAVHQLKGLESGDSVIELRIPFRNKVHSDMLTDAGVFKAQEGKPISIKEIKVSDPFSIVGIEPKAPVEIKSGDAVEFRIRVNAPEHNYTGPLTISFETAAEEVVHIEIARTILEWKGKRTEIESSARMLNVQKNGIIVENVQLYKAMSFGDIVTSADVEFPFRMASTEPKLPVKLDTPNGYIMGFFIQAPDHSYSGDLVIKIS